MPSTRRSRAGSSRRSRRGEDELYDMRPVGSDGSRPPALDLKIRRKLMFLAFANIIPIGIGTYLFFAWSNGWITFKGGNQTIVTVMVVLVALVVIGICWWVLFPFSVWLRSYPRWHFHHMSKMVWAVPLAGGYIAWFLMWVACVGLSLFSVWLIGQSVMALFQTAQGG